ncbi:tetratricopeptide repeat protein [uncultured Kordia sp.]|uniref:tetratricopeptide repeat protein n=1 Tax=uncultured Kordia sp. TaxID=507699 RepID=UPI00260D4B95|nr:tetratricopeptide repeat protein [uncultured Kordia sp.]
MKKQSYLFLVLFFSVTLLCYAQNKQQKIDSLTVLLETTSSDSLRVSRTIDLGVLIDTSDPIKASEYFKNALTILENEYTFSDKATQQALAYDCLGIIERRRNNYDKALQYYLTSLKIKEKAKDSSKIGRSYHNIAMLFRSQKKYDKAISYMKKALVMRRNDSLDYGVSLNNYGHFLYLKKELDSALIVLDSAKNYFTQSLYLSDVIRYKAKVYRSKKMYQKAFELHKQNLVIYKKEEKIERLASTMKDLAFNARKMNLFDAASKYLDSSEVLATQYGNKILLGRLYLERYKIERDQKNYKKALSFYRTYKRYRDSSRTIEQSERFEKLALEFKFKQEAYRDSLQASTEKIELQRVAQSQRAQKRLFAVLFFLALLALVSLFLLYRYKRKINLRNRQKQELETELLNEKVNFLRYKTERLLMDNKMRIDFKKELLDTIKVLQTKDSSLGVVDSYQSILMQLKNQISTEKRLDSVSEVNNMSEANFEIQLAKRFPDLTKAEREICHLMYLNLNLKEIMNVRNATLSSIKSARYRIRKKLEVPKGEELELFIKKLF